MDDGRAGVLDGVDACVLRDPPASGRRIPSWSQSAGVPIADGLLGHGPAVLRPAEDVDEVDPLGHVSKRRVAPLAEHLVGVRVHRDAAVAQRAAGSA